MESAEKTETKERTEKPESKKPAIFAVDDDPDVLRAVTRDLKRHYGSEYKVLSADSGPNALEILKQMQAANQIVALFLVDQRMPEMNGVEFLEEALQMYPDAKRALLTAYSDIEAAIRGVNKAKIDYYFVKPWSPPEEKLFPVIDDLLRYWRAPSNEMEDTRVVGHRWSPDSHRIKDFLARNLFPYTWVDVESQDANPAARRLIDAIDPDPAHMPMILFRDGSCMQNPTNTEIAEKIGIATQADKDFYDLVIVGGGPAGLAGAVYGASEGLSTLMIECTGIGGQAGTSSRIENYLGFPVGLSGKELTQRGWEQATRFGVKTIYQLVKNVRSEGAYHLLTMEGGAEVRCHALLLATGVAWRKLETPGVEKLTGKGVYYGAATTEAMACQGEKVFIIGGANSAGQAAMEFSKYAEKVTMLVRSTLAKSMSKYLIDQIYATENIEVREGCELLAADGDQSLEKVTICDKSNGSSEETVPATSVFIFIGAEPNTEWLDGSVLRDKRGFILAGPDLKCDGKWPPEWKLDRDPFLLETSVPGIFAAGDARYGSVKRVASGVGEGSIAISFIHQYLSNVV